MSTFNLRGVHVFQKIPGKSEYRLAETHPALRLGHEETHLFIQDGRVFDAGGTEVQDLPGWFTEAVSRANPVALREAGWTAKPKGNK